MENKKLNIVKIAEIMTLTGLSQSELAKKIGVSKETVSQWLKGKKYPRPLKLLLLSKNLKLSFDEIVLNRIEEKPVVAYRTNKNKKITEEKNLIAEDMGEMLKVLLPYLNINNVFTPSRIKNPEINETFVEKVTIDIKKMMNINSDELTFSDIMSLYNYFRVIFIPVMWGEKGDNGLSIYLPKNDVTFVYANLEKNIADFKYWLLHELSHAITPSLIGKDAEIFAERFAAIMLFPKEIAAHYYDEIIRIKNNGIAINKIKTIASNMIISPYTIYNEINNYAVQESLPELDFNIGGAMMNFNKQTGLVSKIIFEEEHPDAEKYIKICTKEFKTIFFDALSEYIKKEKKEAGIVQRLMNIPIADAKGVYKVLAGK